MGMQNGDGGVLVGSVDGRIRLLTKENADIDRLELPQKGNGADEILRLVKKVDLTELGKPYKVITQYIFGFWQNRRGGSQGISEISFP